MAHLSCTFKAGPLFSSRQSSIKGSQRVQQFNKGQAAQSRRQVQIDARKKDLHPKWHEESKVFCNGEEVLVTSGTKASYTVDIWSGNHPFYQGAATTVVTDEGSVNRFKRRYAGLESLSAVETITSQQQKK